MRDKYLASDLCYDLDDYFKICGLGDLVHYWNEIIGKNTIPEEQITEENVEDN